jgi:hypothetical protein
VDDLRAAVQAFFDTDEAVVIRVRHELEPHQQRLLAALGAGYIVDEHAEPCPLQCGREECQVSTSARTTERVTALGLGMASLGSNGSLDYHPAFSSAAGTFGGSWSASIRAAGFEPLGPGRNRSGREPKAEATAGGQAPDIESLVSPPAVAAAKASRPEPKWISVPGTGLRYRDPDEALEAADEIEADGARVAEQAAADGNEPKAAMATEASRQLAEKIRAATRSEREPQAEAPAGPTEPAVKRPVSSPSPATDEAASRSEPNHLLVKPEEMAPFQRALTLALIAGMRAAADALEQELA